jgi:hypothetical protein
VNFVNFKQLSSQDYDTLKKFFKQIQVLHVIQYIILVPKGNSCKWVLATSAVLFIHETVQVKIRGLTNSDSRHFHS